MDNIIVDIFQSWQVRTLVGLVLIDIVLGIAAALRAGQFEWSKMAQFYQTNVLPYILGYVVFFAAVTFVIPEEGFLNFPPEVAEVVNGTVVGVAWATLLLKLGISIADSFKKLYSGEQPT